MTDRDHIDEFGAKVRAAEARDVADGALPGASHALIRILSLYLEKWFSGEGAVSTGQLAFDMCRWTRNLQPGEYAEQTNARAWLTEEARHLMAAEMLAAGGREVTFALVPEADGRYGRPLLCFRGHSTGALVRRSDCTHPRALFLHSHPHGILEPSDVDMRAVELLLTEEVGCGIIAPDAERLYLIREPGPPRLAGHLGPPEAPTGRAADFGSRRTLNVAAGRNGSGATFIPAAPSKEPPDVA